MKEKRADKIKETEKEIGEKVKELADEVRFQLFVIKDVFFVNKCGHILAKQKQVFHTGGAKKKKEKDADGAVMAAAPAKTSPEYD